MIAIPLVGRSSSTKLNGCWANVGRKNKVVWRPFKRFHHCTRKRTNTFAKFDCEELRTKNHSLSHPGKLRHFDFCGLMWACVCSTIVEQSVETASTPFNIFENKGKVESTLNENLNRFKLDSTRFQQAFNIFYAFYNVGRPVQTQRTFGLTKWCMLKQILEPCKRALTCKRQQTVRPLGLRMSTIISSRFILIYYHCGLNLQERHFVNYSYQFWVHFLIWETLLRVKCTATFKRSFSCRFDEVIVFSPESIPTTVVRGSPLLVSVANTPEPELPCATSHWFHIRPLVTRSGWHLVVQRLLEGLSPGNPAMKGNMEQILVATAFSTFLDCELFLGGGGWGEGSRFRCACVTFFAS